MAKDFLSMASPSPSDVEHFGVKGMRWGVRKSESSSEPVQTFKSMGEAAKARKALGLDDKTYRKMTKQQVKQLRGEDSKALKEAKKNPNFKEDVKAAKKSLGVSGPQSKFEGSDVLLSGAMTGRVHGVFYNHKGERVSQEYANAVMDQAIKEQERATKIKIIAATATAAALGSLAHDDMEEEDLIHFGVKGMKWGVRKSDSSSSSSGSKPIPKAPANENSAQKYDRLRAQIKSHGPNSLEPDELNFVNARTEAIAKINKMNVSSPGWLTDTSKVVLQETTKTLMKDLAVKAGKEFIVKPLIKGK